MGKRIEKKQQQEEPVKFQSYFRPITQDFEEESCQFCFYSGQDIDTFPCAKCHSRH